MNHDPSEYLPNSLLASQDLAFFEEVQEKVSCDQIRGRYDELEDHQTWNGVSKDFQPRLLTDPFLHPTYHRSYLACNELFPKLFVV